MKRKGLFFRFCFRLCLSSLGAQQTLTAQMEQLLQDDLLKVSDVELRCLIWLTACRSTPIGTENGSSGFHAEADYVHHAPGTHEYLPALPTSVYGQGGAYDDGVLHGNMFVKGALILNSWMRIWMSWLHAQSQGLRKVKGKFWGCFFLDSLFYGEGWCWDDAPYDFQPMLSPLMFHKGCVDVSVVPYKKGVNHVTVVPRSSFYTVENLTTNSETGKFSVGRDWMNGKNDLVIQGSSLNALNEKWRYPRPADFFLCIRFVSGLMIRI